MADYNVSSKITLNVDEALKKLNNLTSTIDKLAINVTSKLGKSFKGVETSIDSINKKMNSTMKKSAEVTSATVNINPNNSKNTKDLSASLVGLADPARIATNALTSLNTKVNTFEKRLQRAVLRSAELQRTMSRVTDVIRRQDIMTKATTKAVAKMAQTVREVTMTMQVATPLDQFRYNLRDVRDTFMDVTNGTKGFQRVLKATGTALKFTSANLKTNVTNSKTFKNTVNSFKNLNPFNLITRGVVALTQALRTMMPYMSILGMFRLFKQSMQDSVDAEENQNLFMTAFGKNADKAQASINGLVDKLQLNTSETMKGAGALRLLAGNLVKTREEADGMAIALTERAADMSSLYNMDLDKVLSNIQSGMAGNATAMKKYGVNLVGAKTAQERFNRIMDQTKISEGDLLRTQDSLSNINRRLTASFKNLRTAIGDSLAPLLKTIVPMITVAVQKLTVIFQKIAVFMNVLFGTTKGVAVGTSDATDELDDMADSATKAAKAVGKLAGFDEINIIGSDANDTPETSVAGGLGGFDSFEVPEVDPAFLASMEEMRAKIEGIMSKLKELWELAKNPFRAMAEGWSEAMDSLGITGPLDGLKEGFAYLVDKVDSFYTSIMQNETIMEIFKTIGKVLADVWAIVSEIAEQAMKTIGDIIEDLDPKNNAFTQALLDFIADLFKEVQKFFDFLAKNRDVVATIVDWLIKFGLAALAIKKAIDLWKGSMKLLNAVMAMNPATMITLAVIALIAALATAYTKFEGFRNFVDGLFKFLKDGFNFVGAFIVTAFRIAFLTVKELIATIINGIILAINGVLGGINLIIKGVNIIPGVNVPELTKIPYLASGGLTTGATLAMIGEGKDQEAVLPLNDNVFSKLAEGINKQSGGGNNQPITVQTILDGRIVSESVINNINDKYRITGKSPILV